jgi:hypothetical protein
VGDIEFTEAEDEALGGASGFEEFGEVELDDLEASQLELGG